MKPLSSAIRFAKMISLTATALHARTDACVLSTLSLELRPYGGELALFAIVLCAIQWPLYCSERLRLLQSPAQRRAAGEPHLSAGQGVGVW